MAPTFSVLVFTPDARSPLLPVLRGLEAQTLPYDRFECVIVRGDAGADPRELLAARPLPFHVEAIRIHGAGSRAQALAAGIHHSRGDILVIADGAALPAPRWLEAFEQALRGSSVDGGLGAELGSPSGAPIVDVVTGRRARLAAMEDRAAVRAALGDLGEPAVLADLAGAFARVEARAVLGHCEGGPFPELERGLRELLPRNPRSLLAACSVLGPNVAMSRALVSRTAGLPVTMEGAAGLALGVDLWEAGARFGIAEDALTCSLGEAEDPLGPPRYSDVASLFYRHPYELVLRLVLWLWEPCVARSPFTAMLDAEPSPGALRERFRDVFSRPIPAECIHTPEAIKDRYEEMLGSSGTPGGLDGYLEALRSAGVYAEHEGGARADSTGARPVSRPPGASRWDWDHTTNWITKRTRFHEELLASGYGWNAITPAQRGEPRAEPGRIHVLGRYDVEVPGALLARLGEGATLTLPLPVEDPHQTEVRIGECSPRALEDHIDRAAGLVRAFPLRLCEGQPARVQFAFECVVHEQTAASAGPGGELPEARHLRIAMARSRADKAAKLLDAIASERGLGPGSEPLALGRAIYDWILENVPSRVVNRDADFGLECGLGSCFHRARLFTNLCRLAGIPARERSGAILGRRLGGDGSRQTEQVMRGHSAFLHTWAELHDPSRGWVPADFLGWSYGARAVTEENVGSLALRREIARRSSRYDDYYFGSLDPHRIRVGEGANRLVTYPIGRANLDLTTLRRLLWDTRHRLSCALSSR